MLQYLLAEVVSSLQHLRNKPWWKGWCPSNPDTYWHGLIQLSSIRQPPPTLQHPSPIQWEFCLFLWKETQLGYQSGCAHHMNSQWNISTKLKNALWEVCASERWRKCSPGIGGFPSYTTLVTGVQMERPWAIIWGFIANSPHYRWLSSLCSPLCTV